MDTISQASQSGRPHGQALWAPDLLINALIARYLAVQDAPIAFILQQLEKETACEEVCRKAGISEARYTSDARSIEVRRFDAIEDEAAEAARRGAPAG